VQVQGEYAPPPRTQWTRAHNRARCGGELLEGSNHHTQRQKCERQCRERRKTRSVLGCICCSHQGRSAVVVVEGVSLVALGLPVQSSTVLRVALCVVVVCPFYRCDDLFYDLCHGVVSLALFKPNSQLT
jgi:hypothetical protein